MTNFFIEALNRGLMEEWALGRNNILHYPPLNRRIHPASYDFEFVERNGKVIIFDMYTFETIGVESFLRKCKDPEITKLTLFNIDEFDA